jgi:4-amino-4-deoxy-L-arabinose transferase-like glycosyltransferase
VLWLASIWLTGAAPHRQKLPLLLVYSVVCAVIIVCLPVGIVSSIRRVKERLERDEKLLYAILGAVVLNVGGVYAYVQQGWPDETHVFAAARIAAEQGVTQFFADYTRIPWLGTQHPPLALLVYGGAMRVFGVSLFVIRLVSLLLGLATLLLTYRLGSTLYDRHTGLLAAGYLLATPFFFRVGATALTDMPVTFCFVLAVYVTLCLLRTPTYRLALALGLCIGAGLLCRYTMVFIYLVLTSYITVGGAFRRLVPHLAIVVLISAGMLATWFAYAYHLGVLATQRDTITSYSAGSSPCG